MTCCGPSLTICVGLLLAIATIGCGPSRPTRITAPVIDPKAVASAAAAAGDLNKIPALAFSRDVFDTNNDKNVSEAELVAWLKRIRDSRVAIVSVAFHVSQNGKPLSGAEIRLEPEACMNGAITEASGKTDQSGMSLVTIPGSPHQGVNCGLYRVEITGIGNDGKPLAAKYNSESTLGVAVGATLPENGLAVLELN